MEENKPNYFARTLTVILGLLISSLILSRFYYYDPQGEISNGLIILISLLLILSLSEIFDSFSLGQFLSLKRTIKEKDNKIVDLKSSNEKLLNLVVTNNNSSSQRQSVTHVAGISPEEFAKTIISVIKADKETTEKEENRKEKIAEIIVEEEDKENKDGAQPIIRKRLNLQKLQKYVLTKFIENKDLKKYNFIEDAQILMPQKDIDPISLSNPIFDGYIETENYEMFIEIKLRNAPLVIFRERLYVMLSKLFYYRLTKKSNIFLNLILVDRPDVESKYGSSGEAKIISEFEPAIRIGLLKIEYVQLSNEEMPDLYREE